ncbi:MarR family transcriptional regulator [Nocardia sp. CA2R105]|uniref:MarR family winged helix-turn-helix transcriptional regulator n=1 Tax=Nocardia coffeae TaxID=2873381 RepID=UPI001CA773AA|nr:MarR family transcriptional regulator [Nocardia coffeae]MBY8858251.1 MarR family transcriptional regulator [Nocardia coffeae]
MTTTVEQLPLAEALVRLSHRVQQVFAEVSRRHDLTPQQAQLLCRLAAGPVGMSDLTRWLALEKSSLTGLVDRAQRRGLVVRIPHETDRRAFQIALTDAGAARAEATHRAVIAQLDALLTTVSPAHREQLSALITDSILDTPR